MIPAYLNTVLLTAVARLNGSYRQIVRVLPRRSSSIIRPGRLPGQHTENTMNSMNFGAALEAIKAGKRIARTGWNGKGMFVYFVPPASYPVQTGAAKAHFGEGAMVPYNAYMAIKNVDGTVSTWVPSVNDCLATDWGIIGDPVPESSIPHHQQRVIDEKAARDSEISRITVFIDSNPVFPQLPADEQARLRRQLDVMRELSVVLGERIAAFF